MGRGAGLAVGLLVTEYARVLGFEREEREDGGVEEEEEERGVIGDERTDGRVGTNTPAQKFFEKLKRFSLAEWL